MNPGSSDRYDRDLGGDGEAGYLFRPTKRTRYSRSCSPPALLPVRSQSFFSIGVTKSVSHQSKQPGASGGGEVSAGAQTTLRWDQVEA